MRRAFTNLLCADVEQTAKFYQSLLGLKRHGDFGWFIILTHDDMPGYEFGLLQRTHSSVPTGMADAPKGVLLTFVVDDVLEAYERAQKIDAKIVEPPTEMPYGQTRLLLQDPEGTLVDISAPTPKS